MKRLEGWDTALITKLKNSLTAKIFLVTCLLLTAVCVLTYGLIAQLIPITYTDDQERLLVAQTDRLAEQLKERTLEDCAPLLSQFTFQYGAPVSIQDSAGPIVSGVNPSDIMPTGKEGSWEMASAQSPEEIAQLDSERENYVVHCIGADFTFRDSSEKYQLLVLGSTRAVNQAVEALGRIWPWLVAAILLVSVLTSLFYAHFITRPIVRLSGISQKLFELDFSWRCKEKRTDEIGTLARNLDELAARLSRTMQELQTANATLQKDIDRERQLEQAQRDFFSAVSHELKTPITIIKGQLSGMLDGIGVYADRDKYLARSLTVANQMEILVQELLTVSRMEKNGALSMVPVELTALIRKCLQNYNELFQQKGQKAVVDLPSETWSMGEPALLKKALGNLLSNAALYSPEGAQIYITVHKADKATVLTVENEGTHISPELLPHLFEPFFRGDPSRSRQTGGSGLGLYLVQKIADRHGGACQIQNTQRGVCATLVLPNSTETTY